MKYILIVQPPVLGARFLREYLVSITINVTLCMYLPYTWNYWLVEYLAIGSENAVDKVFILRF